MKDWNDVWLMDRCRSDEMTKLGDVDNWAYSAEFERLATDYRKENEQICTDGAVHKRCVFLRKKRFRSKNGSRKLRKFERATRSYDRVEESLWPFVAKLYFNVGRSVDRLSYTEHFEGLFSSVQAKSTKKLTRHDVWRTLLFMRKKKLLPSLKNRYKETFGL